MVKYLREYFLTYIFIFAVFFDQIFICSLIITGTEVDSGIKQYEAILFSLLIFVYIFFDFIKGTVRRNEIRVLIVLFILILLYYLTHFFYPQAPDGYTSYLLVLGGECFPAAYIGSKIARHGLKETYHHFFILLIIITTYLQGTIGLKYATANELVNNDESGLNYQQLSYFMAYCFSYCCYFIAFTKFGKSSFQKAIKFCLILTSIFCCIFCVISGGRGGLYFMLLYSILFLLICLKHHIIGIRSLVLLFIVIISTIFLLDFYFDAFNSVGLSRVLNRLTEHNTRSELYDYAIKAFYESPIFGNGLGSVWWTVGFYSHNIFLDVLSEVGIIGCILFIIIIAKATKKMIAASRHDKLSLLFLIILFGAIFHDLFSGYWIGTMHIFMCCAYAFGLYKEPKESALLNISNK